MRTQITLYIDGKAADIQEGQLVLLTYQREDLTNPTAVVNSYSQQITLPGTKNNEQIFSRFRRSDRVRAVGQFDTMARVPFRIMAETGEILQAGYIKLEKVERSGRTVTGYTVTLFGGLGDFIYSLMYDGNGDKRSLANLQYDVDGTIKDWGDDTYNLTPMDLRNAWDVLAGDTPETTPIGKVVNFAPCYNGIPEGDFSADVAMMPVSPSGGTREGNFYWDVNYRGQNYKGYNAGSGNDFCVAVKMIAKHDEWEVGDLRVTLQRPVLSIDAVLNAMVNTTFDGWAVTFSGSWRTSPWFVDGWVTMQTLKESGLPETGWAFADLFQGMPNTADFLLGLMKLFGLVLDCDPVNKTVTVMSRDDYYGAGSTVDITDRLDVDGMEVDPFPMQQRWQRWQYPDGEGGEIDAYLAAFGKPYGSVWLDTGYPFDGEDIQPLEGIPFVNTADTVEAGDFFKITGYKSGPLYPLQFKGIYLDLDATWTLYSSAALSPNDQNTISCGVFKSYELTGIDWVDFKILRFSASMTDWLPKPQFCDADGKPLNGAGALLFHEGRVTSPIITSSDGVSLRQYYLLSSDGYLDAMTLNNEKPSWQAWRTGFGQQTAYRFPSFRRNHRPTLGVNVVSHSFDISKPRAFFDGETTETAVASCKYPFTDCWQAYLTDRYDADARVVRAKVDLSGFRPGPEVLQNFYWFDDALWVLNKVENWSLTTDDLAECEFIKVTDPDAYTSGQNF